MIQNLKEKIFIYNNEFKSNAVRFIQISHVTKSVFLFNNHNWSDPVIKNKYLHDIITSIILTTLMKNKNILTKKQTPRTRQLNIS